LTDTKTFVIIDIRHSAAIKFADIHECLHDEPGWSLARIWSSTIGKPMPMMMRHLVNYWT